MELTKPKNICNILLQEKMERTKAVTDFTINDSISIHSKVATNLYQHIRLIALGKIFFSFFFTIHIFIWVTYCHSLAFIENEDAIAALKNTVYGKKKYSI